MAARPVSLPILSPGEKSSGSPTFDAKHGATVAGSPQSSFDDTAVTREQFANNPFLDPKVAEHYRAIYEKNQYECRHVFDPELEWTTTEEKRLVRRLDWHVALWACMMFFALNVDRGNLKQAVSDNLLPQLGLTTNDYNYGTSRTS